MAPFDQLLRLIEMFALRGVVRNAAVDRVPRTAAFGCCRIRIRRLADAFVGRRVRPRVPPVEVPGRGRRSRSASAVPATTGQRRGGPVLILVLIARFGRRRSVVLLRTRGAG